MKLIPSLPSLLEDAVLLETEPELDKIKYKNIDAWHTYAARVRLDGQPLIVQLTTFEQNGMEMVSLYHDHKSNLPGNLRFRIAQLFSRSSLGSEHKALSRVFF
jgi:hypothetical protein